MISFYDLFMRPLEKRGIKKARQELLQEAKGSVLEIGAGTGANIPFYNFEQIESLTITDQILSKHLNKHKNTHLVITADVEKLPFQDNSFDTIVHTLVFCSVPNVESGLSEIYRVLKPGGKLLFIEHVLPKKNPLKSIFHWINPVWKKVASGCHLNRQYIPDVSKHFKDLTYKSFMNDVFIYGKAIK
jgi:ubiquinone/menaquinone biosynthesis C-methylase UbiE